MPTASATVPSRATSPHSNSRRRWAPSTNEQTRSTASRKHTPHSATVKQPSSTRAAHTPGTRKPESRRPSKSVLDFPNWYGQRIRQGADRRRGLAGGGIGGGVAGRACPRGKARPIYSFGSELRGCPLESPVGLPVAGGRGERARSAHEERGAVVVIAAGPRRGTERMSGGRWGVRCPQVVDYR